MNVVAKEAPMYMPGLKLTFIQKVSFNIYLDCNEVQIAI
jgi:hypothetical protein